MVAQQYPLRPCRRASGDPQEAGFSEETAAFLAAHIVVDRRAGRGTPWGRDARGQRPPADACHRGHGLPGLQHAMHELGHCVEQTFSLTAWIPAALRVPNTAFTEAFAFVFQTRDTTCWAWPKDADARAPGRAKRGGHLLDDVEIAGWPAGHGVWHHM